ncbi:anthranilate synthase component I [Oleiagrimonas sp. C23AA]|uniref:anthranilate synthase component I n=1 Tax=Oleiagrimonas sp. C23AA TaxID=2719047 RepID=UPI0014214A3E|nr:anthranilate synthase component I [Oleiagrimonas sp. C23AA]
MISQDAFDALAREGHTRIPVVREVFSDLDTPLSVYMKLADGPYTFLFESVEGGENWGRYSIIGLPAKRVYKLRGHTLETEDFGEITQTREVADPLAEVEALRTQYDVPKLPELPAFTGGLVGYFGFETIGYIEPRLARWDQPDELGTPDVLLMLAEELAVFDSLKGRLYLIVHADPSQPQAYARAQRRLDELVYRLRHSGSAYPDAMHAASVDESDFKSSFTRDEFEAMVEQAKEYIRAGDIFQVVPSQRLSVPFTARPVDVYRALRALNPSPYMYFLDLGGTQIVGSSPEILARLKDGKVVVRPLAGTRKRGATEVEDRALEAELLADPKERAEHVMLIDLGRNDVGRVSDNGSVEVTDAFAIERYSHVMHIVSQVQGTVREGLNYMDVLKATFPAGTLSGAPKIRALEIIQELEPFKRNIYAGAIGWIGWWGDADTAIAIRTAVIQDGRLHVQAGAGIVYDSDPSSEWEETMNKGRALFRAVAQAASGL